MGMGFGARVRALAALCRPARQGRDAGAEFATGLARCASSSDLGAGVGLQPAADRARCDELAFLQDCLAQQQETVEGLAAPWFECDGGAGTYQCFFCSRVPKDRRARLTRQTGGVGRRFCTPQPLKQLHIKVQSHQASPFHQEAVRLFAASPECAAWRATGVLQVGPELQLQDKESDSATCSTCSGGLSAR